MANSYTRAKRELELYKKSEMKILITGNYERDYNRTIILLDGLKNKGVELIEYPYKKFNSTVKSELSGPSQSPHKLRARARNDVPLLCIPAIITSGFIS